jgi:diguanylate cyclase (GGDEF)-like protein
MPHGGRQATFRAAQGGNLTDLHERLRLLDRRDWWLWWTATSVMVGLLAVIVILTLAAALHLVDAPTLAELKMDIRGLAALVVLFNLYAIHQQLFIKRLRAQMVEQVEAMILMHGYAEKQRQEAVLDPLTGLYNRRLLRDRLTGEMARSERHHYPLTLVTFDLDKFKPINDQYGHAAGDLVLKSFAGRLKKITRGSDVAARTGGDEFLLILPDCQPRQVERVLSRLNGLQAVADGKVIPYGFSVGWAEYQSGETLEELLERADQELYRDKRARSVERAS